MLLRLKYETDGATVVWLAAVLARWHEFAGPTACGRARTTCRRSRTPATRQQARAAVLAKFTSGGAQ